MLITTSRKPSQRTRSFCKSLANVLDVKSINRGKMSIRDVLVKSSELGSSKIMLVSEMKGNPNKIDFQDENGETLFSMDVTVGLTKPSASKDRVEPKSLKIYSEVGELIKIGDLLGIPLNTEDSETKNLLLIKGGDHKNKAVIEFYGSSGDLTGPKIFIKDWRT